MIAVPVKEAFNNIFFEHLLSLARPAGAADRSYLPIAGDSAAADGWRQATGTPVWGTPYGPSSDE